MQQIIIDNGRRFIREALGLCRSLRVPVSSDMRRRRRKKRLSALTTIGNLRVTPQQILNFTGTIVSSSYDSIIREEGPL